MAELKHSGYKAAASSIAWTSGQGINSLVDDEYTDLSDEIDNTLNLYLMSDVYLDLGTAVFSGADSAIEIFCVPTVDGSTYPTWTGNGTTDEPENEIHAVGEIPTTGASGVQDLVLRNILLPPGKFKWAFRNRGGVTLNATNTAYWRPYNLQIA